MDFLTKEVKEILKANEIVKLTPIQEASLPLTMKKNNVVVVSKTGSGKTLTFLLPIVEKLLRQKSEQKGFAIIVSPTKDLAVQIHNDLQMFRNTGLRSSLCINSDFVLSDEHVVIGTPGSVSNIINSFKKPFFIVFDEIDRLLSKNHEKEIKKILSTYTSTNKEVKTDLSRIRLILSTATFSKDQLEEHFDVSTFKIAQIEPSNDKITQYYAFVPFNEKFLQFHNVMKRLPKCIVFVSRVFNTFLISNFLNELGYNACYINGLIFQKDKNEKIRKFKSNEYNILVCTDILARGIDIPEVENVINFDLPTTPKEYVHRIGRTARKDCTGNSITLLTQYDIEKLQRIEHFTNKKMIKFEYDETTGDEEKVTKAYEIALKKSKLEMKTAEKARSTKK